ncbi:MAG: DNA recombination protein RmuC [Clostridia bacterium]|nr:DNA recombination protein RmuC [Clostridia bacterium]
MIIDIVLICLCALILGLLTYVLVRLNSIKSESNEKIIKTAVNESLDNMLKLITSNIEASNKLFTSSVNEKIGELRREMKELNEKNEKGYISFIEKLNSSIGEMSRGVREENERAIKNLNQRLDEFTKAMSEHLRLISEGVDKSLKDLRRENTEKLGEIQKTVDDKLQKALDEKLKSSFENVVLQIGNVNKAIGEIKTIAQDVGSLKTVLTNVKTKGIVGEVILGNIISEILTKDQYEQNVATKKGSRDVVEFAIKMPSTDEGYVLLPVDSKFPLETYYRIKDGIDSGDKNEVESARKELRNKLRAYAKDISTKYIDIPQTTDFAIMFLPIEGLYIEAIEAGLFEDLQREYRINLVGPSTFAALLNALRSGFNSLAIQKRSSEVFKLLEAIKSEFETFAKALLSAQARVNQVSADLETLVGTRTRQMQRKLKDISTIPLNEAREILEITPTDTEGETTELELS